MYIYINAKSLTVNTQDLCGEHKITEDFEIPLQSTPWGPSIIDIETKSSKTFSIFGQYHEP